MSRPIAPVFMVLLAALISGSILASSRPGSAAASQATPATGTPCPATSPEENKALVLRLYEEAYGLGRVEVLDELLADDSVVLVPGVAGFLPTAQTAESIHAFRADFPNLRVTVEDVVAEGDRVAVRMTNAGTQADPLEV